MTDLSKRAGEAWWDLTEGEVVLSVKGKTGSGGSRSFLWGVIPGSVRDNGYDTYGLFTIFENE